jgi:hypothetical protein
MFCALRKSAGTQVNCDFAVVIGFSPLRNPPIVSGVRGPVAL